MSKPLVTIRVNSYNHAAFLKEAVLSALNQTYENKEVIVIDDGSTDNSMQVLDELSKTHDFFYKTQENKGVSATMNDIIKYHAKGKYIIGTASDDVLEPDVVEKYVDYMEKHPEYGMCYGNGRKINDKSELIGTIMGSGHTGNIFKEIALGKATLPLMTFMWRADIFENIGYYEESIASEDIYMLYKVSKNYPIGYVNTFAKRYRVHLNNSTTDHWKMYENAKRVASLYQQEPFYDDMMKIKHLQWFYLLSRRYKRQSLKYFWNALRFPFSKLFIGGIINLLGFGFIIDKKRYK